MSMGVLGERRRSKLEAVESKKVRLAAGGEVGVRLSAKARQQAVALKQVRGESGGLEEVEAEKVRLSAKVRRQTGALVCGARKQKRATSAER